MKKLYYGVAYYDEYMPCDRLDEDIRMMKDAGINVVRIAESTWSTMEPRPGYFDYSHIDRVLDGMYKAGIDVIIGTPTYAIPSWLEKMHPEVIAETKQGRRPYGARQIMDITSPAYLFYGERVIRKLMKHVCNHPAVIGYQIDNETKYYGTAGNNVQRMFVRYLRDKFGTTDALNAAFGFDYWSNRVDAWEDVPDVRGTINGSFAAEFEKFQRSLVTDYLSWQASIVREYARPDQFVTHNLDFNWTGYSNGIQPDVDHDRVAECLDITGCDIYHPTQEKLTGIEIAQSGDQTRSLKNAPYLVLETEAQGFPSWTPFPGQLRLQAISHLASGAEMVEYWHWHSIHNSMETYWKGLLSHDFKPSAVYQEAKTVGKEFAKLSGALNGLHKENKVAILVSNIALTSLKYFPISGGMFGSNIDYNGVVRWMYQTLYHMNVGVDFIYADSLPEGADLSKYSLICIPALYAAPESLLKTLLAYEENGGTLLATFKTAFADENIKVYHDEAPHMLSKAFGLSYSQFTVPENVRLDGIGSGEAAINWMELLIPENGTEILSRYDHPYWKAYAAITRAKYGNGQGYYIGCHAGEKVLSALMTEALKTAGVDTPFADSPVTVRQSVDSEGRKVTFLLNYSMQPVEVTVPASVNLLTDEQYPDGATVTLPDWGYLIIRE
ncbi:MAG TPA: beta-galactosidase [Candidatus Faecivivens stercoripullorum]|uniref:Beta-galactosidase n=1 Tax=Candidatus Faecivivens stercoripullorum TaxID=2840805 RepID=A0A9D1H956_9FIRM|nr:beta-galactosidase [Candidatus Faecivivens stercoripullorum]